MLVADASSMLFATFFEIRCWRIIMMMANKKGEASSKIRREITGVNSSDKPLLSMLGFVASKFGDRPADTSTRDRSSNPQINTRITAQEHDSICMDALLYGRYLDGMVSKPVEKIGSNPNPLSTPLHEFQSQYDDAEN